MQCYQNNKLLAVQIKEFNLIIIVAYFLPETNIETIYQALNEAFQCCQGRARMILGGDFNCRLDSTERGNLLCEFLINWNLRCVNDNEEVTCEFQCGKSIYRFIFRKQGTLRTLYRDKDQQFIPNKAQASFLLL